MSKKKFRKRAQDDVKVKMMEPVRIEDLAASASVRIDDGDVEIFYMTDDEITEIVKEAQRNGEIHPSQARKAQDFITDRRRLINDPYIRNESEHSQMRSAYGRMIECITKDGTADMFVLLLEETEIAIFLHFIKGEDVNCVTRELKEKIEKRCSMAGSRGGSMLVEVCQSIDLCRTVLHHLYPHYMKMLAEVPNDPENTFALRAFEERCNGQGFAPIKTREDLEERLVSGNGESKAKLETLLESCGLSPEKKTDRPGSPGPVKGGPPEGGKGDSHPPSPPKKDGRKVKKDRISEEKEKRSKQYLEEGIAKGRIRKIGKDEFDLDALGDSAVEVTLKQACVLLRIAELGGYSEEGAVGVTSTKYWEREDKDSPIKHDPQCFYRLIDIGVLTNEKVDGQRAKAFKITGGIVKCQGEYYVLVGRKPDFAGTAELADSYEGEVRAESSPEESLPESGPVVSVDIISGLTKDQIESVLARTNKELAKAQEEARELEIISAFLGLLREKPELITHIFSTAE